ncbi:hypothetical protein JW766_00525 [Candidatus Dojkabacteria bacterium]|nr:hypothetical protein [Candidatus Dojkabacteria bacterium]
MTEQFRIGQYRATFTELTSSADTTLQAAKENDQRTIESIIELQRQLEPGQVLVLTVSLITNGEEMPELEHPNKYAELVYDEPWEFTRRLREVLVASTRYLETGLTADQLPSQIEIIIPPDRTPEDDLGVNTSASRAATLSGARQKFLDMGQTRIAYLDINLIGTIPGIRLSIHPSIIREIRIEESSNNQSTVGFRAIS